MARPVVRRSLIRDYASALVAYKYPVWHYGDSAGMEGLLAASRILGDDSWQRWVHGLTRGWAARNIGFSEIDNTVPGVAICQLVREYDDPLLLDALSSIVDGLVTRRTYESVFISFERACLIEPYGGEVLSPAHQDILREPGAGIFVDCIDLEPNLLVHFGDLVKREDLVDLGVAQARAWLKELQDESTGLMWHFALERTGERYGFGWGRGQGWALFGLADVLDVLPSGHDEYGQLVQGFRRLADAMADLQRPDGGWYNLVHDPASGDETSTAAFMAAAFARGLANDWLPSDFGSKAQAAWSYVEKASPPGGSVRDVSVAVWASTVTSHYVEVPRGENVPWGQGPACVAVLELVKAGLLDVVD